MQDTKISLTCPLVVTGCLALAEREGLEMLSAGIIPVRKAKGTWRYLFLRAFRNWDFPKGVVEPGENPLDAAKREVREETGITDLHFRWGKIYGETDPYSHGRKVARYYIAETKTSQVVFAVNPEIGKAEHHEYRWLTYDALQRLAPQRLRDIIKWANHVIGRETS
ncbi:MAG: NUDIX domain-containing protein [Deltaproteobacteria bacterium]